jgi:anaerobic magnesium-protoporphyrin IX monomethyl ester cyclase
MAIDDNQFGMNTWLIYPPFADPTQPYLSLPYLKACLRAEGWEARVLDLNVEAAHYLLGPEHAQACARNIAERFAALNGRRTLNRLEQMEYLALADARPAARRLLEAGPSPAEIFQDPDRFYQIPTYRRARNRAEDALTCTSAAAFPFRFHFNQAAHVAVPWGPRLLESYFQKNRSPLDRFYRNYLAALPLADQDAVGISLTFVSQIPEAFYLAQLLRQIKPALCIVLGGSCLQQMLAHGSAEARKWIVTVADAVCAFEGETTLPRLLTALAESPSGSEPMSCHQRLAGVPNLLVGDPQAAEIQAGPLEVTDLSTLPMPDYSDLDLDRYLAPEKTLLFAPTRGCYWNRCAFCDYGLSRSQCHSYREMSAAEAARQLGDLAQAHGVRNFYLSVDVMSPRFALDLARALVAHNVAIRWSADFRIENHYTAEHCKLLYQSGLRAAAFGVESGSPRLLEEMDKGISVPMIRKVSARFHQAGIATAWMTFSGHPGETVVDATKTLRLIEQERTRVDLFILGRFGLTSGSLIAANPDRYGLGQVYYCKGDAFRLFPLCQNERSVSVPQQQGLEDAVAQLSRKYFLDHYPWAGAISTHHSFLYLLRYGQDIFRRLAASPPLPGKKRRFRSSAVPTGLTLRPKFSIERLRSAHERNMQQFWEKALALTADGTAPLDQDFFNDYFT